VIGGRSFSPCLIYAPGEGHAVSGELFEVEGADLAALDRLEGTDLPGGYRRIAVRVRSNLDSTVRVPFTYAKSRAQVSPVHGAPLAAYSDDPRYVPPTERSQIFG